MPDAPKPPENAPEVGCIKCGYLARGGHRCPKCELMLFELDGDRSAFLTTFSEARTRRYGLAAVLATATVFVATVVAGGRLHRLLDGNRLTGLEFWIAVILAMVVFERGLAFLRPVALQRLERRLKGFAERPPVSLARRLTSTPLIYGLLLVGVYAVAGGEPPRPFLFLLEPDGPPPAAEPSLWSQLALNPMDIRAGAGLLTLATCGLVHASLAHLETNVVGLLAFGFPVDLRVGRLACAGVLVAASLGGALAHALLTNSPEALLVGASCGVYGLIGAQLVLMPKRSASFRGIVLPNFAILPVITLIYAAVDAATASHVAWLGHLGGFVVGVALGIPLRRIPVPAEFEKFESKRESALEAVG